MNEIVKYNNNLNTSLKDFKSTEMNLLMVLCSKVRDKKSEMVTISFDELKKLAGYKPTANDRFIEDVSNTNVKLMNLKMQEADSDGKVVQFVLFPTFEIDPKGGKLSVEVNSRFSYLLNNLTGNFTRFELEEFTDLHSIYAKSLYRILKQWRTIGEITLSLDQFKKLLDVPDGYTPSSIDARVLKPIEEELSTVFSGFKIEKKYEKKASGKGRPSLSGFKFSFTPERRTYEFTDGNVKESGFVCPKCGRPLYEKQINGDNCWCHLDGWKEDAVCNAIYNSIAEINGYSENSSVEAAAEEIHSGTVAFNDIMQTIKANLNEVKNKK